MTREQFIQHIESEQASLRRFLLALCCGNRAEADDIAQEALIKAYLSIAHYRDEGKFNAWLYRIAHNTFLDRCKSQPTHTSLDEAASLPDPTFNSDRNYQYQELYQAIATLPPKERTAILLYYLNGYTIKEISHIINCNQNAVKKQLSRGREQLKIKITQQ